MAAFPAVPPAGAWPDQRLEPAEILPANWAAEAPRFDEIRCFYRCYQQIGAIAEAALPTQHSAR
jgi:hypothetical protein